MSVWLIGAMDPVIVSCRSVIHTNVYLLLDYLLNVSQLVHSRRNSQQHQSKCRLLLLIMTNISQGENCYVITVLDFCAVVLCFAASGPFSTVRVQDSVILVRTRGLQLRIMRTAGSPRIHPSSVAPSRSFSSKDTTSTLCFGRFLQIIIGP